jgi:hypothetical protein
MHGSAITGSTRAVSIPADDASLDGELQLPTGAIGVVAFAHGSGSSRHSPRNRLVAASLRDARLATLLFDLLHPREEQEDMLTGKLRFDIELLGRRLIAAVDWLSAQGPTAALPIGCFGAPRGRTAARTGEGSGVARRAARSRRR